MRKAIDLTKLDSRVAIYVERQGKTLQFLTHSSFTPKWNSTGTDRLLLPADLERGPDLSDLFAFAEPSGFRQNTPATSSSPHTTLEDILDPPLTTLFDDTLQDAFQPLQPSLRLTNSPTPVTDYSQRTTNVPQTGDSAASPTARRRQVTSGKKRRRPASTPCATPPTAAPTPASPMHRRKRARTASTWFDN